MARAQRRGIHPAAAVRVDEPQSARAHARLMGDLQPGDVAFARGVELPARPAGARAPSGGEARVRGASARKSSAV